MDKLKPCPKCGDAWLYVSVGDWASGYECYGFRVNCKCGYAWKTLDAWFPNKEQAIKEWNRRQKVMYDNEELVKLLRTCAELRGECSLCIYQGNPCGCMPEALLENAAEVIEELIAQQRGNEEAVKVMQMEIDRLLASRTQKLEVDSDA